MSASIRSLRDSGEVSFGSWIDIGHPVVAELMATVGFDWLAVDLEHAAVDISQCLGLIQAIKGQGVLPMARLPFNDKVWIRRALDVGFAGIIVPLVNTVEEAAAAVRVAKYPPDGERGIGFAPANLYGTRFTESVNNANVDTMVIAQVETGASVDNVEGILSVKGIDGVFMGPYDLSGSYGILGQLDHPLMEQAYKKVLSACKKTGKLAGIHVVPPVVEDVEKKLVQGFNFIALSLDITLIEYGARNLLSGARAAKEKRKTP